MKLIWIVIGIIVIIILFGKKATEVVPEVVNKAASYLPSKTKYGMGWEPV